MGIFERRINPKNKSDFEVYYEFKHPEDETKKIRYYYYVPLYLYVDGIRSYFDIYDVNIDGTDNHIFNVLSTLGALKELESDEFFKDFLTEACKKGAYEEFLEKFEEDREMYEQ